MAGLLLKLNVKVGDSVTVGQEVAILEAMKMESGIPTPVSGKVVAILAKQGDSLAEGQAILQVA
jgi:biotin carboxyl carrier protein